VGLDIPEADAPIGLFIPAITGAHEQSNQRT
jgi:hypothetical protein